MVVEGRRVQAGEPIAYAQSYAIRLAEKELTAQRLKDAEAQQTAEVSNGKGLIERAVLAEKRTALRTYEIRAAESRLRLAKAQLAHSTQKKSSVMPDQTRELLRRLAEAMRRAGDPKAAPPAAKTGARRADTDHRARP